MSKDPQASALIPTCVVAQSWTDDGYAIPEPEVAPFNGVKIFGCKRCSTQFTAEGDGSVPSFYQSTDFDTALYSGKITNESGAKARFWYVAKFPDVSNADKWIATLKSVCQVVQKIRCP